MDISILIIANKDRGYLGQAIESALKQTFEGEFETIIQKANLTMAQNTNAGVRQCYGEYVKWLHDDDILYHTCLTDLWKVRGADVICANSFSFYQPYKNNVLGTNQVTKSKLPADLNEMVEHYSIHASTLMYRREVLLNNPLDETLWTGEEFELNLRLFKAGYKFAYVDKLVSQYRIHEDMKSYSAYGHVDEERKLKRWDELERIRDMYR